MSESIDEALARLRAEYDPTLEEPIPQRLRDALVGPTPSAAITPIGAARKTAPRPSWSLREWGALAAAVVLGAVLGPVVFRDSTGLPIVTEGGRLVAAGYLDAALSTQLAGTTTEDALARVDLSFRATDGEYCRVFALRAAAGGVACRRDGRWTVHPARGDHGDERAGGIPADRGAERDVRAHGHRTRGRRRPRRPRSRTDRRQERDRPVGGLGSHRVP